MSVEKVVTFYCQPSLASRYVVQIILPVYLIATFVSFCRIVVNLKTPKVAPWHRLGVHGPYFSHSCLIFIGFTCPAVVHESYQLCFLFIIPVSY